MAEISGSKLKCRVLVKAIEKCVQRSSDLHLMRTLQAVSRDDEVLGRSRVKGKRVRGNSQLRISLDAHSEIGSDMIAPPFTPKAELPKLPCSYIAASHLASTETFPLPLFLTNLFSPRLFCNFL